MDNLQAALVILEEEMFSAYTGGISPSAIQRAINLIEDHLDTEQPQSTGEKLDYPEGLLRDINRAYDSQE